MSDTVNSRQEIGSILAWITAQLVRFGRYLSRVAVEGADGPSSGQSGWYVRTGEGKAVAEAAKFTEAADLKNVTNTVSFDRAVRAVKEATIPDEAKSMQDVYLAYDNKYQQLVASDLLAADPIESEARQSIKPSD